MPPRRIKDANGLAAAIRDAIELTDGIDHIYRKAGLDPPVWRQSTSNAWKTLCPFHDDHEPSLDANNAKGQFRCRAASCQMERRGEMVQTAGDLIWFARWFLNMGFFEACSFLCSIAKINIEPWLAEPTEEEKRRDAEQAKLSEMFLGLQFLDEWPGKRLSAETLKHFNVFIAPGHIKTNAAGEIVGWGEKQDDMVILPIQNERGVAVGWVTRSLANSGDSRQNPKTWPGAEDALYGFHQIRSQLPIYGRRVVAVEGQTDAMAMYEAGIKNSVALRGANMTEVYWNLMRGYNIREITLCLDGDKGGQAATQRIAQQYWNVGPAVLSVATLPEGLDPGNMVDQGRETDLMRALTRPSAGGDPTGRLTDSAEYLLNAEIGSFDLETMSGRRAFIDHALHDLKMSQATGYRQKLIVGWLSDRFSMPTLTVADMFQHEATPVSTREAELGVIARAMQEPNWALMVSARVQEEDFQYTRHQILWRLVLHATRKSVDCTDRHAFVDFAKRHGYAAELVDPDLLDGLSQFLRTDDYWLEQMIDGAFRRHVLGEMEGLRHELVDANHDAQDATGRFSNHVMSLSMWRFGGARDLTKEDQARDTLDIIARRRDNPDEIIGHDLGPSFPSLNLALRGVQKRRLHVVAAAQSVGKTTFLTNSAALFSIWGNVPGLFIGLEMDYNEYNIRLLAQLTGIDAGRIDSGRLDGPESRMVERAAARLAEAPLWIRTPDSMDTDELVAMVRGHKLAHGIQVVYYDYAQLTRPAKSQSRMNRYEVMGELARVMKLDIARGMDLAFMTAAQMNREGAKEKKPTAEFIGDSYMIAQTADTFLILSEVEGNSTLLDLKIDKNRAGTKDIIVPLKFERNTQILYESGTKVKTPPYRMKEM